MSHRRRRIIASAFGKRDWMICGNQERRDVRHIISRLITGGNTKIANSVSQIKTGLEKRGAE